MERRRAMKQNVRTPRLAYNHIGAAAAEKSALAVWRYVDVNEAGHGRCRVLHPLHVQALLAERPAKKLAEVVLTNATDKARPKTPARKCEGTVGSNATDVHLQTRRKAI